MILSQISMAVIACVVVENLINFLLPEGKLKPFVKAIVGVFLLAVLAVPIIDFVKSISL